MDAVIYTDHCTKDMLDTIHTNLFVDVAIRNESEWSINYVTANLFHSELQLIVINKFDERAISEITLGAFTTKTVLVTDPMVNQYPHILPMVNDVDVSCNLNMINSSFIDWYQVWRKNK